MHASLTRLAPIGLALTLLTSGAIGCDSPRAAEGSAESASAGRVSRVDGAAARQLVAQGAFLLDVRSTGEFQGGHIEGAVNIPVQELRGRLAEVPEGRPVVVYCLSGGRSSSAASTLAAAGYEVHDLGPMSAYAR